MSLYLGIDNVADGHEPGRLHQCAECGRVFTSPFDTRKHLETVHSIYNITDHGSRGPEVYTGEPFNSWSKVELLQSIHESIDWLHRLSNMVRKASFNHQNKRDDDFMLRDENGEKSVELTRSLLDGLKRLYQFYVKTHAAGVGEPLAQRLVQTMIIRHKRVLHRRARRKVWNMEQIDYSPRKIEQKPRNLGIPLPAQETTAPGNRKKSDVPQPPVKTEISGSRVTATTVDVNMIRHVFAQSEVSKATSNSLLVSDRALVPPRPAAARSGIEFICDYCGLLIQARQASSAAAWA